MKMEQFSTNNPNPIPSVANDWIVLYSNVAGEPLLHEWGVEVGEKLPPHIGDFVQRVISLNLPEKMEVKAGNRVYLVSFHPLPEEECVNIYGFDISDQKELKEKLLGSELREMANPELAEIIDAQAIQSLMDDFYKLAHIPIGIIDLKGNVLVGVGWQDICTEFHRVHPQTCKHCVESDTKLSTGVFPGEFKPYKCKNNRWDIVSPIMVGGQHVGNIFLGQFFFEGETLDYELFRSQARQYGFNEEEYIAALEKVPRLSREVVDTIMAFFMKLANMLSQLGYSNIKLAQSLAERNTLVDALRESEKRERARSDELVVLLDAVPATVWIAHDPRALKVTGNRLSYEWLRIHEGENASKSAPEGERPETYRVFKDGVEIPPADMPVQMSAAGTEVNDYEFEIIYPEGVVRHVLGNARPLLDEQGNPRGSISAFIDITEHKRAEETLAFERSQLLSIFDGIDDVVYVTDPYTYEVLYANKRVREKFGGELAGRICYREFQRRDSPCDFCTNQIIFNERDKSYHWEYYNPTVGRYFMIVDRIIKWPDGRDVRFEIAKDITERKKAEESLRLSNLYNRSLIEASLDPLVTIGPDGKIMDVNGATEHVTGYSRSELIGTDFSDYFTEPEKASKGYQQVFTHGEVRDYPLEIQHKDGHITPVLYNASVYRGENGEVIGVFAAARDITERQKAEEALKKAHDNLEEKVEERTTQLEKAYKSLKESENGLAEAQKMAHIGNWDWNIITNKLYLSNEVYRIYGCEPQEVNVTRNVFLSYVHPDDRDYVDNTFNKALNEKPINIDYRIILANREERVIHAQGEVIFNEENIPVRTRGTIQDITERKKSEEKIQILANIVESSNDAIGTISLDDIITSYNKEAEQVYGYSAEEILGKHTSFVAPPHLDKETKKLSELIKQGKKIHHHETSRLRKNGEIIYVSITLSPVFDIHGKMTAISFISRDITERKKAEDKIKSLANVVESSNDAIITKSLDGIITSWNKGAEQIYGYSAEEILGKHISLLEHIILKGK